MDRNRFNAEVRHYLTNIPIGRQGIAFDRLELDAWVDEYKSRNGRRLKASAAVQGSIDNPILCAISRWLRPAADSRKTSRIFLIDSLAVGIPPSVLYGGSSTRVSCRHRR